jgi:hypothetical protein
MGDENMGDKNTVSIIANNSDGVLKIHLVPDLTDERYFQYAKAEKNIIGASVQDVFIEEARKLGVSKRELLTQSGAESFFYNKEYADRINEVMESIKVLLEKEQYKSPFEILGGSPGLGRNKS